MREKKKKTEGNAHTRTGHVMSLPTLGVITALVLHIATFVHVNLTYVSYVSRIALLTTSSSTIASILTAKSKLYHTKPSA